MFSKAKSFIPTSFQTVLISLALDVFKLEQKELAYMW